ncbi:hypothetical protein Tco_0490249 [Tanacetum coccineum]
MRPRRLLGLVSDFDCKIRYHTGKASVATDALSKNERAKPLRVRALVMTINLNLPPHIHKAQVEYLKTKKVKDENLHDMDKALRLVLIELTALGVGEGPCYAGSNSRTDKTFDGPEVKAKDGPDWMFNLELLTPSMNYIPVRKRTSASGGKQYQPYDDVEDLDDQQFIVHGPSINAVQNKHSEERTADKELPLSSEEQALHDELVSLMHQESIAKLHNDGSRTL